MRRQCIFGNGPTAAIMPMDVASMLTSNSLHITSQVVGGVPLMGNSFNSCLPSSGTRTDARDCFPVPTLHPPPRGAGNTVPHQILLATNGQVGHSNDQGVPVLPVRQCPQTCPAPFSHHSGTTPPFHPQTRQFVCPPPPSCGHRHHGGQSQSPLIHHCC